MRVLTPLDFIGSMAWRTTLGTKASGLRETICCLVSCTNPAHSSLLEQPWHWHASEQYDPAAKQSQ